MSCCISDREVWVLPILVLLYIAVWFITPGLADSPQHPSSLATESSLEPEFAQLRAKLGSLPEYSGTDAASKFKLAEELARRGDMHGAIESYRASIHLKPDWADAHRGLGQVLLDHHEYADAVQSLQSSIRLGRDDHQVFYWLGRAFMGKGDFPAAALALVRATELDSDDAESFADLGLVRMAQGDLVGATQAVTTSIQLKPEYAEAHRLQEILAKHGKDPVAVTKAAQSILHDTFAR